MIFIARPFINTIANRYNLRIKYKYFTCTMMKKLKSHPDLLEELTRDRYYQMFRSPLNESEGTYGKVMRCVDPQGRKHAIKEYKKIIDNLPDIIQEIKLWKQLDHPCILKLQGAYFIANRHNEAEAEKILVRTGYCSNGDLLRYSRNLGMHSYSQKLGLCLDVARGVQYLHGRKCMHRDIKPQNVLLDEHMNAIICDFGFCKVETEKNSMQNTPRMGTPMYSDPALEGSAYSKKCDIFSIGCVIYFIFTGSHLFDSGAKNKPLIERQRLFLKNSKEEISKMNLPEELKRILERTLTQSQSQRVSAEQLVKMLEESYHKSGGVPKDKKRLSQIIDVQIDSLSVEKEETKALQAAQLAVSKQLENQGLSREEGISEANILNDKDKSNRMQQSEVEFSYLDEKVMDVSQFDDKVDFKLLNEPFAKGAKGSSIVYVGKIEDEDKLQFIVGPNSKDKNSDLNNVRSQRRVIETQSDVDIGQSNPSGNFDWDNHYFFAQPQQNQVVNFQEEEIKMVSDMIRYNKNLKKDKLRIEIQVQIITKLRLKKQLVFTLLKSIQKLAEFSIDKKQVLSFAVMWIYYHNIIHHSQFLKDNLRQKQFILASSTQNFCRKEKLIGIDYKLFNEESSKMRETIIAMLDTEGDKVEAMMQRIGRQIYQKRNIIKSILSGTLLALAGYCFSKCVQQNYDKIHIQEVIKCYEELIKNNQLKVSNKEQSQATSIKLAQFITTFFSK